MQIAFTCTFGCRFLQGFLKGLGIFVLPLHLSERSLSVFACAELDIFRAGDRNWAR